jgi:pyruvate/oxaloacetate carboxyltransferase
MAEMALLKAIEAGVDGVDTAISSMSATYGHPATEALVATLAGTPMTPDWISTSWKISPPVSARCAKSTTPLKAS